MINNKQPKCSKCKVKILEGRLCPDCKQLDFDDKLEKRINRKLAKTRNTVEYGISAVKKYAETRCWCSTHKNCFRASFGKSETDAHIDKKFERWKYHKRLGRAVFCELRLMEGYGRPDLIIVDKGFIFVEEIVCSEKEASIIEKKGKYPWPINVIKV